jgi:hypothetical protein
MSCQKEAVQTHWTVCAALMSLANAASHCTRHYAALLGQAHFPPDLRAQLLTLVPRDAALYMNNRWLSVSDVS